MQQRHKEKQQLLLQLEEAARLCWAECTAQKARREAEKKAQEKAERQRVAEKEERKRRMVEYLQQLCNKMLEEEAALLERAKEFQVIGSKHKEVIVGDEKGQRPSKKARGKQPEKYHRGATVKMGGANFCKRYVSTRQDYLVHHLR